MLLIELGLATLLEMGILLDLVTVTFLEMGNTSRFGNSYFFLEMVNSSRFGNRMLQDLVTVTFLILITFLDFGEITFLDLSNISRFGRSNISRFE